jgi:phosphoserine phosphatase
MNPSDLQRFVLDEMQKYLQTFEAPLPGTTLGTPWSRDKVAAELETMRSLLVIPYEASYVCGDSPNTLKLTEPQKKAWVVAADGSYKLLFDPEAGDFVLVHASREGTLASWGIRGDASSTFLAR